MMVVSIHLPLHSLAKDLAPSRKHTIKRHFKKQTPADTYVDPFENGDALKEDIPIGSSSPSTRHWSISNLRTKFKKANSFHVSLREPRDDGLASRRRDRSITTSTFYDDENMAVTKSVSEPADFVPLELKGKNMNELLMLLKPVSHT